MIVSASSSSLLLQSSSPSSQTSSSTGIRDVAMREIRNQIIIIHKDSIKRFNQLYRMLRSNPHLGYRFRLESCLFYCFVCPLFLLLFEECVYYILSYLPESENLLMIPYLLMLISVLVSFMIDTVLFMIISPLCYLIGYIFPTNIQLSIAYYRDIFGSNPDLNPPVIIDEMSDKLRSIVDNYRPLPSTTSFDYLRFVKGTKRLKYKVTTEEERELVVTGSFIEFIKYG